EEKFEFLEIGTSEDVGVVGATLFVPEEERCGKAVIGIDVSETKIAMGGVLYDEEGRIKKILGFRKIHIDSQKGPDYYYQKIREELEKLKEELKGYNVSIHIGLSHPGKKRNNERLLLALVRI
ncbi:MAG: hypothetical protein DRI22_01270, partial [Caldiserica bacterium]